MGNGKDYTSLLPAHGDLHGGPFGRRDRPPAPRSRPDPPDASPGPPEQRMYMWYRTRCVHQHEWLARAVTLSCGHLSAHAVSNTSARCAICENVWRVSVAVAEAWLLHMILWL